MENMDAKKEAIKRILNDVRQLAREFAMEKPNEDPSHEAMESEEHEGGEMVVDAELSPENGKVAPGGPEVKEPAKLNPFGSDEERWAKNQYKGGKARSMKAGMSAEGPVKPNIPFKRK